MMVASQKFGLRNFLSSVDLRVIDTLAGEAALTNVFASLGNFSNKKEFAPIRFFPFRIHQFFQRGIGELESKQEVTKDVSLKMSENHSLH